MQKRGGPENMCDSRNHAAHQGKINTFPLAAPAREAEKHIPSDPALNQLWPEMSREYSITTTPSDADVYMKEYAAVDSEWKYIGKSPIERVRIPLGFVRWKVQKAGFRSEEGASPVSDFILKASEIGQVNFALDKEESIPPGMVRVRGGYGFPVHVESPS